MNYLALYRKYRPKDLDEVVGQEEVKKILASSVKNGTITHAYLFFGPRGTGKTTMAKILAKMVNCEHPIDGNACNNCDTCLNILNSSDVIEIDAASNNGVDEIRDLREKVNLVPTNAKYKIYIIDEVHMLTIQAFNALLKTLEEPPKHVIFVLATTEYYKIPMTITSRCQKFQFSKISDDLIVDRLREISKLEKIDISDDALYEIAKISDGGMRDSINFLDQLCSSNDKTIELSDVYQVCGNVSMQDIQSLFVDIRNNKYQDVITFFDKLDKNGNNYGKFLEDVICFMKDVVLYKENVDIKYIKTNIDCVKNISELYSSNEIYEIIDFINKIFDRLKNVSKQSVIIISNFLLLLNKINNNNVNNSNLSDFNNNKNEENNKFDNAFMFTTSEKKEDDKFTDKEVSNNIDNKSLNDTLNTQLYDSNKDIIINNAFTVANKDIKNDLQSKISLINDYFTDKKFMLAAGALIDISVEVAGRGYIIFSSKSIANVSKIYDNYKLCSELINKIFDGEYYFVVITSDEWMSLREEYIKNIKNGIKYELKKIEHTANNTIVIKNEPTIVDKLFDLVGEENVEIK